jgi:hypothetical protein
LNLLPAIRFFRMKVPPLLVAFLIFIPHFSACRKEEDPRISQLQKDVRQLSEENRGLKEELQTMRQEMAVAQRENAIVRPSPQTQTAPAKPAQPQMTVDRMKRELQPMLVDFIQKLKAAGDTPRKGNQYGMRIEYDLTKAIYGLVQNDDPDQPFTGKVIVPYRKFLESEMDSKSYGEGTTQFIFIFQDDHWSLQTFQ